MEQSKQDISSKDDTGPKKIFSKFQIIKNLLVLSIASLVSFCASDGWAILQSTVNSHRGVGVISISVQYACGCIAALLLPKYLTYKFGSKLIIVASMLSYIPYLASNLYPHFSVMIPASIIVGFGSTLIWASTSTYLNDLSSIFVTLHKETSQDNSIKNKTLPKVDLEDSPPVNSIVRKHKDSILILKPTNIAQEPSFYTVKPNKSSTETFAGIGQKSVPSNECFEEMSNGQGFEDYDFDKIKAHLHALNKVSKNNEFPLNLKHFIEKNKSYIPSIINSIMPEEESELPPEIPSQPNDTLSNSKYINSCQSKVQPSIKKQKLNEITNARFFGFFGCIYMSSHIFSSIISYFILNRNSEDVVYMSNANCTCGAKFCTLETACYQHNIQMPNDETKYILTAVFVTMSFVSALFVLVFLDEITVIKSDVTFSVNMAIATLKLNKRKNQILITPISIYMGTIHAFVLADYPKDFVGCAWGVKNITLVMICCGCIISLVSYLSGWLEEHLGRFVTFLSASILNVAVIVLLLTWTPNSDKPAMMFVVAGMYGTIVGIMWNQIRAFIGIIFKDEEEAAYGCYQFWHAFGISMGFAYSSYLCSYVKTYLMLIISTIGVIGYLTVERNHSKHIN